MKVRIANNSIRLRLKQPEVASFLQRQHITEVLEFRVAQTDQLRFVLEVGADQFAIAFASNTITLQLPKNLAEEWVYTKLVGIEETIGTGKGKWVKVLIEKDFACLDKPEEENRDTYPNPKANC